MRGLYLKNKDFDVQLIEGDLSRQNSLEGEGDSDEQIHIRLIDTNEEGGDKKRLAIA